MKKRIFIAIHYLEIGGAETSLIGLLQALDYNKYDVDLFVYSHRGELMKYIPNEVHLLPEIQDYAQIERPLKDTLRNGYWRIAVARILAKWRFGLYRKRTRPHNSIARFQYVADYVVPGLPSLKKFGHYDLAISFLIPHNIVLQKVDSERKVAWIHTDYSFVDVNVARELKVWGKYSRIVSISDQVTAGFLSKFPSLEKKIILIENILSPSFVRTRSEDLSAGDIRQEMSVTPGVVNLLSVGRFTYPKNYDNIPDICKRILAMGLHVRWYIIGFGTGESLIRKKIADAGVQEHVILLGKKENPYPYIKACDLYIQPSRYEGKSVTVREAQILCKPVVITNYPTASSQVKDGVDGIIVPLDNQACAEGIVRLARDKEKQNRIICYLCNNDYGNAAETQKIDMLFAD